MNLPYILFGYKYLATVAIDGNKHQFTFRTNEGGILGNSKKVSARAIEIANRRYDNDLLHHNIVLLDVEFIGA